MVICRKVIPGKGIARRSLFGIFERKQEKPVVLRQSEQQGVSGISRKAGQEETWAPYKGFSIYSE